MVNMNNTHEDDSDIDITSEGEDIQDPELTDIEEKQGTFKNELREKLKTCEAEKRTILEDSQRLKADFLNARKRLEDERKRDRERTTISHIESLIPLCDSFVMAMSNKEVWEKADITWRKGMEGIYAQLMGILAQNNVVTIDPVQQAFNPHEHEALSTTPVTDESEHDRVMKVIQLGYKIQRGDNTSEIIRPARVIIGAKE